MCDIKKTRTTSSVLPGTVYSLLPDGGDVLSSSLKIHSPKSACAGLVSIVRVFLVLSTDTCWIFATTRRALAISCIVCGVSAWANVRTRFNSPDEGWALSRQEK